MCVRGVRVVFASGVLLLIVAAPSLARDCSVAVEAESCTTTDECACGASIAGGACVAAASECVGAGNCDRFCYYGYLRGVCRAGRCIRGVQTACAGDCDADAAVGIAELMVGVGIALDRHPIAACPNLDRNRDAAAGVDELLRAVRATLEGCAKAAVSDPTLRGTYDAEVSSGGQPDEGVAEVRETDEGLSLVIRHRPNAWLTLSGPLVDGRVTLSGDYAVTDIVYGMRGDATVAMEGGAEVIRGDIESTFGGFDTPSGFVLYRVPDDDPVRFSGAATFTFSKSPRGNGQPSRATVAIDVAGDGTALSGGGEDRGLAGELYGTLTSGTCSVAPAGHLYCFMNYLLAGSAVSLPVRFTGRLHEDGGGEGVFLAGIDPPFFGEPYVDGSWSAE